MPSGVPPSFSEEARVFLPLGLGLGEGLEVGGVSLVARTASCEVFSSSLDGGFSLAGDLAGEGGGSRFRPDDLRYPDFRYWPKVLPEFRPERVRVVVSFAGHDLSYRCVLATPKTKVISPIFDFAHPKL